MDFAPLFEHIANLKFDANSLNPITEKIEATRVATVKQMSAEFKTLVDSVQQCREAVQHAKVCEEDLHPVLEKLDRIVNPAFFSPVLNKMDVVEKNTLDRVLEALLATRVATVKQMSAEFETLVDSCNNVGKLFTMQRCARKICILFWTSLTG